MSTGVKGILLTTLICCVWPVIVHFAWMYFMRNAATIRWDNIRDSIRGLWSKHD